MKPQDRCRPHPGVARVEIDPLHGARNGGEGLKLRGMLLEEAPILFRPLPGDHRERYS